MEKSKDIQKAKELLLSGELVAIPTETVYGLAANGLNEESIKKIYEVKNRPSNNPLILHFPNIESAEKFVNKIPDQVRELAKKFSPGPLTYVLPRNKKVPDIITAGKDSVAIRIPNHPLTLNLLNELDFPLAAPSANPSNYLSPTSAEHVTKQLNGKIELVLDGGECEKGIESTILSFEEDKVILLRYGAIAIEDIVETVGDVYVKHINENDPSAPGMLLKHYSPKKHLIFTNNLASEIQNNSNKKIGILSFKDPISASNVEHNLILSADGNFNEAAKNLFAFLHKLDELNIDLIIAEKLPDSNLGKAINDRLERASK